MEAVLAPEERVMGRAGEDDFSSWVQPHLPAMQRLAARLVDPAEADDVVQEALVRAWRRWSTYDEGRGPATGWLLAILADRARRHRTRSRVPEPVEAQDRPAAPDVTPDVDLERAIVRLSGRQRTVVELYYFVGADVATCAQAMCCAEGTVRATLHQARARLRELMGEDA
jgi:RNA polymerase sigma-70 factor (ECF subfamily)